MATELTEWPTWAKPLGAHGRYPWNDWFNGAVWVLEYGVDFHCKPHSFRVNAYGVAKRRGLVLLTSFRDEGATIALQAVPRET